jgi:cytochrome c-type biogenesis protein CcmH/NrfG
MQYVLIGQHLDYAVVSPLIPIANPLALDPLSLSTRFTLLVDQLGIGPFLLLFSAVLLVAVRKLFIDFSAVSTSTAGTNLSRPWGRATSLATDTINRSRQWAGWVTAFVIVLLLVVFGRAPLALVCNYQAQHALYAGDYAGAYRWFGYASELNPALELLSSYHNARGQAWYFLHPDRDNVDSSAYLASAYLEQKDYLAAYQELQRAWQSGEHAPWLINEMSMTLMQLATVSLPQTGSSLQRPAEDSAALAWFNQLLDVDPDNVFGQYMVSRIQYELHNYSQCEAAMRRVIALSQSANVLSSAYTYLALSSDGQGDYVDARTFLLQAVSLDPKYRNNTAREELSGLR